VNELAGMYLGSLRWCRHIVFALGAVLSVKVI
jgi:hypothetical protein